MKKLILIATILVFTISLAIAQSGEKEKSDKLRSVKVAFITEKLDLSVSEAEAFWPLYNEFDNAMRETRKTMKAKHGGREKTNIENITEEEAKQILADRLKHEEEVMNLKKTYTEKFLAVLPATKVVKLFKAEEDFKRELLRSMRDRGGERSRGPR